MARYSRKQQQLLKELRQELSTRKAISRFSAPVSDDAAIEIMRAILTQPL